MNSVIAPVDFDTRSWHPDELTRALELSQNGFMRFDAEDRCTGMNDCAVEILGRSRESWLGKRIIDVAPEAIGTPFEQAFQRCRRERGLVVVEREYYPPHQRWYQSRFFGTDHDTVILCFRDISSLVRKEQLEAELRLEAKCRENFEGVLGHDLRNPLSTITYAAASLVHAGDLTASQARSVHRIAACAGRMARMIDSLLDLTRTRGGAELPIAPQPADLAAICRQGVDEAEIANPTRRIVFVSQGDTHGIWDRDRLAQVVSNLVGNALDYSPPDTTVEIAARDAGADVLLEVHNEGPPIPEHRKDEIFQPFRRGEQETNGARPNGLGLGLFITKLVVEAHAGVIQVESSRDHGTTFTVSLPRITTSPPRVEKA